MRAENLMSELGEHPDWLWDFTLYLADRHCPARAASMIGRLGIMLTEDPAVTPRQLIERTRRPGRSIGTLAAAFEEFFTSRGMVLPTDYAQQSAAARRTTRVDGVPPALRPAVKAFEASMLTERERSRRAGTRPRSDITIERRLSEVRSLAIYLTEFGIDDWSQADGVAVERWVALQGPGGRGTRIAACRNFFAFARRHRLVLIDPSTHLRTGEGKGFRGRTVSRVRQRELFVRWTTTPDIDCNEALAGMLALIHGASAQELGQLRITDIDHEHHCLRLGRRPHPVPIDPDSWRALTACLEHRAELHAVNPHVIVTRFTRSRTIPASTAYLSHVLDAVGLTISELRASRLVALANTHDPNLVATTYGMSAEGVLAYFADRIDPTLLADL